MNLNDYDLILCSTPRLAQSLQRYHAKLNSKTTSQTPNTQTLTTWLEAHISQLILLGEIPLANADFRCLSNIEERLIWQQVIENQLKANPYQDLFDASGLANVAIEANNYAQIWQLQPHNESTEETKQFLQWQKAFQKNCVENNCLEKVRYIAWQIKQIALHPTLLPPKIAIAGYDRIDPQIQSLLTCLSANNCLVEVLRTPHIASDTAQIMLKSRDEECRAAVAWAQQQLANNPNAELAIIVPELNQLRETLIDLLDDTFHPESLASNHTEAPRCYELSLGVPLNSHPLVNTTLHLLKLFSRAHRLSQADFSLILLANFWSNAQNEANQRAILDANLRRNLPLTITWTQLLRHIEASNCPQLLAHCQAALAFIQQNSKPQLPSNWVSILNALLQQLNWPGARSLSSHEYQAQQAFLACLESLKKLDAILGKISLSNVIFQLNQICREQIFQPRTLNTPAIQVLGLLEATAAQCDGVWVMGMNDDNWPPTPRLNPLLPASLQRAAGTPNADHHTQMAFAKNVHERLLNSGKQVLFSWAENDGEKLLRVSPLVANLPTSAARPLAQTRAEMLMPAAGFVHEALTDHSAPPVTEQVKGGTALFKAQAICPAWGYFQYRLGARKLELPEDGLDASARGSLVHLALQHFWLNQSSLALKALSEETQTALIKQAVQLALEAFNREHADALSANMIKLEAERLETLLSAWLQFELSRELDFTVLDCEKQETVEIEGISVKLSIDRIDVLADDSKVIIDYKTGTVPKLNTWAETRIKEPQLPIYAVVAMKYEALSAVAFAHVKLDSASFTGLANAQNILPKVLEIGHEKLKAFAELNTWDALLEHWYSQINAIALEIKNGVANVTFEDEADLKYCEVLPLLRLPERALQFERTKVEAA